MFVGGTSLYVVTTTFWLKVAFIALVFIALFLIFLLRCFIEIACLLSLVNMIMEQQFSVLFGVSTVQLSGQHKPLSVLFSPS